MAKRLLLTLLALLGLAAQVAPAHAAACGRAASALVMAAEDEGAAVARSAGAAQPAMPAISRDPADLPAPAAAAPRQVPVLVGIDRARE